MPSAPARRNGFTLLEMLGVLGVLAILLALIIPVLRQTRAKAKTGRAKADISKIESALNLYKMDYGVGPDGSSVQLILIADGLYTILSADPSNSFLSLSTKEPYLKVPSAQTIAATRQLADPWKTPYWIRPTAVNNPNNFDVFSAGPDKTKGNEDDVNNWGR